MSAPPPSRALLAYVTLVCGAGTGAGIVSALVLDSAAGDPFLVAAVVLVGFAGSPTVPLPGTGVRLNVDVPFLVALAIRGAEREVVLLAGLNLALAAYRSGTARTRPHVGALNLGAGFLGGVGCVGAYALAVAAGLPEPLPAMAAAAGLFALNVLAVAGAIRVATGALPGPAWREGMGLAGVGYLASASIAWIATRAPEGMAVGLVVLPLVAVVWQAWQAWRRQQEERLAREREREELFLPTLEAICAAIEARDPATHGHNRRVEALSVALARELGIVDQEALHGIRIGALLHDIGKIAIPDALLHAERRLTPAELEIVRRHAVLGSELVRHVPFPSAVLEIVRHHHERWDGNGHPDRLAGEGIPLAARIVAICDAFDDRCQGISRERSDPPQALAHLAEDSGLAFDPTVFQAFVRLRAPGVPAAPDTRVNPAAATIATASREQAAAAQLAWRDELTGLGNSRALRRQLETLDRCVVLMLDLDGFKGVNDTYGHEVGDVAIRLAGAALAAIETPERTAYRNGGDEFVVVLAHCDDPAPHLEAVRARLELVRIPVGEQRYVPMRVSVGAAVGRGGSELLCEADAAMYADKRARRDGRARGGPPEVCVA